MTAVEGLKMRSGRVFLVLALVLPVPFPTNQASSCQSRPEVSGMQDHYGGINSIDFHHSLDFLAAGHDKGNLTLYNTYEGKKLAALDCCKYGVSNVRFTHHAKSILHSSTNPVRFSMFLLHE
jgi:WD40 repeat protein